MNSADPPVFDQQRSRRLRDLDIEPGRKFAARLVNSDPIVFIGDLVIGVRLESLKMDRDGRCCGLRPPECQDDAVAFFRPVPLKCRPDFVRSRILRQRVEIAEEVGPQRPELGDVFEGLAEIKRGVVVGPVDLPAEDHRPAHRAAEIVLLRVVVTGSAA